MTENFHESHWGQCLELLAHLCHYSDSILLVTGPEGIGKTTMKQALLEQESDQFVVCDMQGSPSLTAEQLTASIERELDVVTDKDLLLLIDDAQLLALDVIAMLLQLKQKTMEQGSLHIALFATMEFEQKIARSVIKEDFAEQVHAIEIEPLTLLEVEAFLRQQWRATHRDNEMPFDRAKCKKIHALSSGIPGKILEVTAQMTTTNNLKAQDQQKLSPFTVGLTVSFGIVFCILAILWPAVDKDIITKSEITTQPLQIAKEETIAEEHEVAAAIEPSPIKIAAVESVEATPVVEAVVAQAAAVVAPAPTVVATSVINTVAVNDPDSYAEKIASLEKRVTDLQKQVASEQKAQRATELKLQQLLGKQQPEGVKKTARKTLGLTRQEREILALPRKNYTLQLMSMTDENKVRSFIKDNNLQHKANYYKSHVKGKDWFVLVYGNYATKVDAQQALAKLPVALRNLHPQPRGYMDIQQTINKRGKNE